MQLEAQLTATYRERAHLVAFLTVLYPSAIIIDGDPDAPGWALVYVDSPTGQLSWHLSGDDLDLFPHVKRVETSAVTWDNHTTDEKYGRIRQLTADLATFPLPEPRRSNAEQQLALLHEGEQPPPAEKGVSLSPAQMIWRWNRATPAARLAVATQLRNASDQLGRYEWALRNIANLCTCTGPSNCASSAARSTLAGPEPAMRCSDNPTCNGGCCAKPDDAPGLRMDQQCANCPHLRGDHADNIVSNPCLGSYIARPCDCRSFTEPR